MSWFVGRNLAFRLRPSIDVLLGNELDFVACDSDPCFPASYRLRFPIRIRRFDLRKNVRNLLRTVSLLPSQSHPPSVPVSLCSTGTEFAGHFALKVLGFELTL